MLSFGADRVFARMRDAAIAALLALIVLTPVEAQAPPVVGEGTVAVVGDDGHVIAGALVTLRGDRAVRSFRTYPGGVADQSNLTPGVYVVSVAAAGFAPFGG